MEYDVLVIGGGPAGYYCALHCGRNGLRVALVEKEELGGTCFRWGALPVKKIHDDLVKYTGIIEGFKQPFPDISGMIFKRCNQEMKEVEKKIKNSLEEENIEIYFGDGFFQDRYTFIIGNEELKGKNIVIATGTTPWGPFAADVDGSLVITHKELFKLSSLPQKMVIVGGNVEGVEFASFLTHMGIEVTVVEKDRELLTGNDRDLVRPIESELMKWGAKFYLGYGVSKIIKNENYVKVELENGELLETEKILLTMGRRPNVPKGAAEIGLEVNEERILVNGNLKTNICHVYAIGDVNGILGMANAAIQQGLAAAENIFRGKDVTTNYDGLPRSVFSMPEMAGVGLQEEELRKKGAAYKVGFCNFADTWRGISKRMESGFVKLLAAEDGRLLGVWMIGRDVADLVGTLGLLIHHEIKIEQIKENLMLHPSLSEGILEAALNMKRVGGSEYETAPHFMYK